MKTKLLLSIAFFLLCLNLKSQTTFQKIYGGIGDEESYSVQQTTDGGYIICGITLSDGSGYLNVYLIKTDINGDTLWTKTYGGTGDDWGSSVQQTTDGGYIITGKTLSFGAGDLDVYLIKTDTNGETLWTKTYGGTGDEESYSVQQTTDGGYIITGRTLSFGAGDLDVYLIKTDNSGDTLWTKTYGGTGDDWGTSVQQTTDGGYIITGLTRNFGAGSFDVYLIKTDTNGDTLWTKTYGGTEVDWGSSVQQTTDGGYIITGSICSFGAGDNDVYLIKTDTNGDILWTKTYGGTEDEWCYSVQQTTDTGYIITGMTRSFAAGVWDVYLIKTNNIGDTLWTKTYGGTGDDFGSSVQQTTDGGYIITGMTRNFGAENLDVYLIKTDTNGDSGCNENSINTILTSPQTIVNTPSTIVGEALGTNVTSPPTITSSTTTTVNILCSFIGIEEENDIVKEALIYPNPFTNDISIHLQECNGKVVIRICDINGRAVYNGLSNSDSQSLSLGFLNRGVYFLQVISQNSTYIKKIIKQ